MAVTLQAIIGAGLTVAQSFSPTGVITDAAVEVKDSAANPALVQAHTDATTGAPIVILGARLNADCAAPNVLHSRVDRAAQFVRMHPANKVIVTGGETRGGCFTEAQTMEAMLRSKLVLNPIQRDDFAGSTVANAANVSRMTDRAVLVTSQDHLPRAAANFNSAGVRVSGVAAF